MQYKKIFETLNLGSNTLANRYVMGSMHTGLEDNLKNIEDLTAYYVRRAQGGVGMIITGGYSPNIWGRLTPFAGTFSSKKIMHAHSKLTKAVQSEGPTKIILQLLHAGRYSFHPFSMAPSRIKSPITPFTPFAMPKWMITKTIQDFISSSVLAQQAGYNGVEIMGSEGYLLHQFFAQKTNHRKDEWGGVLENRARISLDIVSGIKKKCGPDFIIIFRIPILDLLPDGAEATEIIWYAKTLEKAGVTILNSGIGWHESRIPTIGSMVPEAAFLSVTSELKKHLTIPIIASNRFSHPDSAEKALQEGHADLISMARPFLADPFFVKKTHDNKISQINPCIACNQACLDHIFSNKKASCLVNPEATEEKKWSLLSKENNSVQKNIAVMGAGAAGLNAAIVFLKKGYQVTIFEKQNEIGGQFNLAAMIPGKSDYKRSIIYWKSEVERLGGNLKLNYDLKISDFENFDHVVVASGVKPRKPNISGIDLPHVFMYDDFIKNNIEIKENIVIIGAGGIGIDTAVLIIKGRNQIQENSKDFFAEWGIDPTHRGGLIAKTKISNSSKKLHQVTLLQRSDQLLGKNLGKTTGWIHRAVLKNNGVKFLNNLNYDRITEAHVEISFKNGKTQKINADQVIICAGQESVLDFVSELQKINKPFSVIGGAKFAGELDAKRSIRDAYELLESV